MSIKPLLKDPYEINYNGSLTQTINSIVLSLSENISREKIETEVNAVINCIQNAQDTAELRPCDLLVQRLSIIGYSELADKVTQATKLVLNKEIVEIERILDKWVVGCDSDPDVSKTSEWIRLSLKFKNFSFQLGGSRLQNLPDIFRFPILAENLNVLFLGRNNFTTFPKEICSLKKLTSLNLFCNQLVVLPSEIKELNSLIKLELSKNRLQSLPQEFGNLTALVILHLEENDFSSLPSEIGNCLSLVVLLMKRNRLREISDKISLLTNLTTLDLDHNELPVLASAICQLPALRNLHLSNNRLTALPKEIGALRKLQVLHLDENAIRGLPPQLFQLHCSLERLYLNNNRLQNLPAEIKKLSRLEYLCLQGNLLTTLPAEVGQLRNLFRLDLENNPDLMGIPLELLNLGHYCFINLTSCRSLSQAVLDNISRVVRSPDYRGSAISYSMTHFNPPTEEKSIQESLKSLYGILGKAYNPLKNIPGGSVGEGTLRVWLSRLSYMSDYRASRERRKWLAENILTYLKLADDDPKFRETFGNTIEGAQETCGDRMSLSVMHLGIAHRLATIDKSNISEIAHLLTRGVWALSMLEMIAREKISCLPFFDEIEVYLGYPVMLKEKLQLPIDIQGMLYFSCSALKPQDLDDAAAYVLRKLNDQAAKNAFLITQPHWLSALAHNYPNEYAALEKARDEGAARSDLLREYEQLQAQFKEGLLNLTKRALGE